jgi:hypothetical protein
MVRSRLIVGGPGTGKSQGILGDVLEIVKHLGICIIMCDPHGELARLFLLHLESMGLLRRVLYDRLGSFSRVLGIARLQQSKHENRHARKKENNALIMGLMRVIWSSAQRESDGAMLNHPMTWRYLKYALQLILFQQTAVSLSLLPFCFLPRTPQFKLLLQNCTHQRTRLVWQYIAELDARHSYNLLESQIGGAHRLVETVFDMPEFEARLDGKCDIGQLILNKQIIILDGSDAEPESRTAVYRAWNLMVFRFLVKHFAETGVPAPVLMIWDEAPAANVIGPMENNMLREGRKMGFAGWIAGQDLSFVDPLLKKAVKSTTPEHVWMNPGDDELAMEAAKDVGYAILNPYLEHHRTIRQVHDGYVTDDRISTSITKLKEGDRITTSKGTSLISQFRDIEDVHYTGLNDQILLTAQQAMVLGPGWRLIKSPDFVTPKPVYAPMVPDPYPDNLFPGLKAKKIAKAIAQSQARPEFSVPIDLEEQWESLATSTPSPATGTNGRSTFSKSTRRPRNS